LEREPGLDDEPDGAAFSKVCSDARRDRIAYRRQEAGSFYERWCRRLAASKWRHALRRGSWG
jgi:hypothetical protein